MDIRQNTGEAFFHPVTHQLIEKGQFYVGAAHQKFEKEIKKAKDTTDKNKDGEETGEEETVKPKKGADKKADENNK